MALKIVFLDSDALIDSSNASLLEQCGDVTLYKDSSETEVFDRIGDADVIVTNKVYIGKEQIDAAKQLKLICIAATGMNNVDLEYSAKVGIPVRNAKNYSTESVAQVTMMQILNLVGKSSSFDEYCKSGQYSSSGFFSNLSIHFWELSGKRAGIIGLGNIGSRVAEILTAFGMEVVYYSTSGNPHSDKYKAVSLDELLSSCDIISIHAPLNDRTLNLIGYSQICRMKPTAYLLNMGRGPIVNETDLARALDEGAIAGAATDVFTKEPMPAEHPYMKMTHPERLLLSPHIAWASEEARYALIEKVAENIKSVLHI